MFTFELPPADGICKRCFKFVYRDEKKNLRTLDQARRVVCPQGGPHVLMDLSHEVEVDWDDWETTLDQWTKDC